MSLSAIPFHVFASLLNPFFRAFHILFFSWNDQHLLFWFPAWKLAQRSHIAVCLHVLFLCICWTWCFEHLWTMFIMMWHLNSFEFIWIHLNSFKFSNCSCISWDFILSRCYVLFLGTASGTLFLRQLGVQLGADVPQRQEKMNDTKVDPFLGLQFTISTIGKKHATCLKQQHVCLYGACWNSTDDICIYLCTSRRNIQGKSRLLKDFEEETPQPKEQTLDSPRESMWSGVLRAWAEGNCSHAGSTRNYQF